MPPKADIAPESITIFSRIRPSQRPSGYFSVDNEVPGESFIQFRVPKDEAAGIVNNQREVYRFRFNGIFETLSKQEDVFERMARPVVQSVLDGYNGTLFAYGQTGSGKTFTITGGPEKYSDRGIIPRALSMIYSELAKRTDFQYTIHISFLEIYNEMGHDLLDAEYSKYRIEDIPRVNLLEDDEGNFHLRGLSAHLATNEEDALNILFVGDTNRIIRETPMNLASSRSHCIFTINIEARQPGSDLVRRSKLNLVDLAGSERVHKTNAEGQVLTEAKHINLSLHFLEQVILALKDRSEGRETYVPYRNSFMTSVLRDSLGGNCRTVMIATINPEPEHTDESISTCRFAQRVASIKQHAYKNEEIDPKLLIKRLKKEISDLKQELAFYREKGGNSRGYLTEDEKARCRQLVDAYIQDTSQPDLVIGDMTMIKFAFNLFRELAGSNPGASAALKSDRVVEDVTKSSSTEFGSNGGNNAGPDASSAGPGNGTGGIPNKDNPPDPAALQNLREQNRRLQLQVLQRDNEINILVEMLKRKEQQQEQQQQQSNLNQSQNGLPLSAGKLSILPPVSATPSILVSDPSQTIGPKGVSKLAPSGIPAAPAIAANTSINAAMEEFAARTGMRIEPDMQKMIDTGLLVDRNQSFEVFRKSYRKNEVIEENKKVLKTKYDEAKLIAERVNQHRGRISTLKSRVEQLRVERGMQGLIDKSNAGQEFRADEELGREDPEEAETIRNIETAKNAYKTDFNRLRDLKAEIENVQRLLEKSRQQLQRDFEQWYSICMQQVRPGGGTNPPQAGNATLSVSADGSTLLGKSQGSFSNLNSNSIGNIGGGSSGGVPGGFSSSQLQSQQPSTQSQSQSLAQQLQKRPPSASRSDSSIGRSGTGSIPPPMVPGSYSSSTIGSSLGNRGGSASDLSSIGPGGPARFASGSTPRNVSGGVGPLERRLTGDQEVDDDIRAFYAAREKIMNRPGSRTEIQ